MLYSLGLALPLLLLPLGGRAEEVIHGVVIFSRHGDRSSKFFPPTKLTALGKTQMYESGSFYRARYINSSSPYAIPEIDFFEVNTAKVYAAAPDQNLLVTSGQTFLQGLYPPITGDYAEITAETLANGTQVTPPLAGYQYTTIHTISDTDPATIALKGDDNCPQKFVASTSFYDSKEYTALQASTKAFYESFSDILGGLLSTSAMSYTNAYAIYDYINVGVIHNATIAARVSPADLHQLRTLADSHEWALNGNITSPTTAGALAISGRTLANKISTQLTSIVGSYGTKNKLNILFGSYDTFLAFFTLTSLPNVNRNFRGLPDYASTMAFELLSLNENGNPAFPRDTDDLYVRFLFRNGTTDDIKEYPLFGRPRAEAIMPWREFRNAMDEVSVSTVSQWCAVCGATESFCTPGNTVTPDFEVEKKTGLSPVVAGVVGAVAAVLFVGLVVAAAAVGWGARIVTSRRYTTERGFRNAEMIESSLDLQQRDGGVAFPDKVYAQ